MLTPDQTALDNISPSCQHFGITPPTLPSLLFSKHISGLHTAFWPRDALMSERLRGINAHSVSPPACWYQFHCLVNRDTRAYIVTWPKLLVRKSLVSGIKPTTLRSPGPFLNHTTTDPPQVNMTWTLQPSPTQVGQRFGRHARRTTLAPLPRKGRVQTLQRRLQVSTLERTPVSVSILHTGRFAPWSVTPEICDVRWPVCASHLHQDNWPLWILSCWSSSLELSLF